MIELFVYTLVIFVFFICVSASWEIHQIEMKKLRRTQQ